MTGVVMPWPKPDDPDPDPDDTQPIFPDPWKPPPPDK